MFCIFVSKDWLILALEGNGKYDQLDVCDGDVGGKCIRYIISSFLHGYSYPFVTSLGQVSKHGDNFKGLLIY